MMSFCVVPRSCAAVGAAPSASGDIERQQPRRRRVDRHRRVHLLQRQLVEEHIHVAEMGNRHADLAHLTARQWVVGIVTGLCGQIEGHREAGLPLGEIFAVKLVGLPCRRMPGIGAKDPRPVPDRLPPIRTARRRLALRRLAHRPLLAIAPVPVSAAGIFLFFSDTPVEMRPYGLP
jgi:hypothetical protein